MRKFTALVQPATLEYSTWAEKMGSMHVFKIGTQQKIPRKKDPVQFQI